MQKFTPIFDEVTRQTGLIPAAVYGVVWRYCQMSNHVCRANLDAIALQSGVNKRTVCRALDVLEQQGWIVDLTHTYRNQPHTYQVTGRLAESQPAPLAAACPAGLDSPSSPAMTDSHPATTGSPPAMPHSPSRLDSPSSPAMTDSHMNQTLKRDSLKNQPEIDQTQAEPPDFPEWQQVIKMLELNFGSRNPYAAWLPELRPLSFDGAVLTVGVPDVYQTKVLNSRLVRIVSTMLSGILGRPGLTVTFVAEESRQGSGVRGLPDP